MISASVSGPSLLAARGAPDADPAPGGRSAAMSGPEPGGPYSNTWHHRLVQRSLVLFSVGVVLALVLNLLQIQRNVTLFPEEVIATIFSSAWWVPPCCGTAAGEYPPRGSSGSKKGVFSVASTFQPIEKHAFETRTVHRLKVCISSLGI